MTALPLVSIVIPMYNAQDFIAEAILSVQRQSYDNWEVIAVNDASTDNSLSILMDIQKSESRIKIIDNSRNAGVAKSRNDGVDKASGVFLAFLDADDLWHEDKLKTQVTFMLSGNKPAFTYTGYNFINIEAQPTGVSVQPKERVSLKDYLKDNIIWTSTVMVNLSVINKTDLRMPELSYGEDALTWLNLLSIYGPAAGISSPLASYRRGSVSLSSNKIRAILNKYKLYKDIPYIKFPKKHLLPNGILAICGQEEGLVCVCKF